MMQLKVIFENDVKLSNNFIEKLNSYINQLPKNWDMLFIGDGCNFHIYQITLLKIVKKKCIFKKQLPDIMGNGATKCIDAYLINYKCTKIIINNIKKYYPISFSGDWLLNYICRDFNFKVYWAEPYNS